MQKVLCLTLLSLLLGFSGIILKAQSISYELLGQYHTASDSPDTIKFSYRLPAGRDFCHWEFDVAIDETLVVDQTFIFSPPNQVFKATLLHTTGGGDCTISDANRSESAFDVYPKLALFTVEYDIELGSLASLKRILRSSQDISNNSITEIGNLRFLWNFDAKMVPAPDISFDPNDPSMGQYPNVYYTFPNGGTYQIGLRVVDITNPNDTAYHKKSLNLEPLFADDKIDFENIPNVFTPGGSTNNFFKVETSGINELSFKVFSRSGALVYQYRGNIIKWDGKNYYGQDLPEGIYYYLLEDISPDKKYNSAKGFFYIFR